MPHFDLQYDVILISADNIDLLCRNSKRDVRARGALTLLRRAVDDMQERAGTDEAARCLCLECDHIFNRRSPKVFVIVLAAELPEPGEELLGLVAGLCAKCCERDDPQAMISAALKVLLDPSNDRGDATLH